MFRLTLTRKRRPEEEYLVNHDKRFIYCPIKKVATSSLMSWFLQVAGIPESAIQPSVHSWIEQNGNRFRASSTLLEGDGYFRFVFVRNPWSRLVSGYVNKVVLEKPQAIGIRKQLSRGPWYRVDQRARYLARKLRTGSGYDPAEGLTFRKFVSSLTSVSRSKLNDHWRPQSSFLGSHRFDFIGRFERLADDFRTLCEMLSLRADLPTRNQSAYTSAIGACVSDWAPAEFRLLSKFPNYTDFYTEDLRKLVAKIYARDIARFGYEFES